MLYLRNVWGVGNQASERIAQPTSGQQEAALYGALSGNVERVLPACTTWKDATWALTRRSVCPAPVLDMPLFVQTLRLALRAVHIPPSESCSACVSDRLTETLCDVCSWLEAEVDTELAVPPSDEGLLLETLAAAAGNGSAAISVIGEGLSVGQGKWPLDRCVGSSKPSPLYVKPCASHNAKAILLQAAVREHPCNPSLHCRAQCLL